ncbi:glycosyltransferase [Paenimyroides tangerinum]|uniref:Glycosyltransferase n=1 Tax=Paenimyroides tangerinum TaxID=2488728 RepID=A0A3P3W384_9FLAO|nr:glycosyltransferase [Paenimyroides tangerinum]RRJ89561.1 glycosyltransferase [Paenimyroides tangerinum]
MKLLLLIDSLGSGGAQRQIVTLANILHKNNYDVTVLIYHRDLFFKPYLDKLNINLIIIEEPNLFKRIFKIRKFIRNGRFDSVISFLETPDLINNISSIGGKSWKVITSERSGNEATFNSKRGKILGFFQRFSDAIVCNSNNARDLWIKYYPKYKEKMQVIYNPVLLNDINVEYIPRLNGRTNLIVPASYQFLKNPIGLIEAVNMLPSEAQKKISINWYGQKEVVKNDFKAFNAAKNLIVKYKLEDVIFLNDSTTHIHELMFKSDVVGLFSSLEGLPNVICEALCLGKPIVMTRVSDYKILVNSENGFLCNSNDIDSIKNVLINIIKLSDYDLGKFGANSLERSKNLFSEHKLYDKWLKIIQS